MRPTLNKVTCYKPGTVTSPGAGYSYSDSAGTDGANGFSSTNHGRHVVHVPAGTLAPTYATLTAAQQRDILRFMNNVAMSNIGGVPATTSIVNHFAIQSAYGGYKKWYSVDTAWRSDYLVYWNAADNCAYMMTNLPGWQGAIANIFTKYSGQGYEQGLLGLPTSNFIGDAWGNSWQRFTNGYITSRSTGYGDMTNRAYYVGGTTIEDKALAGRYSKFFDYPGASGANSYPLTQDPQCSNSNTVNPSCTLGKTGRFTKALGPYNYVQTIIARTGQAIAFNVGGEIGNRWRNAYGATQPWNGALGFPKSEELSSGGTHQNFDNGYITWNGIATIYTPASCSSVCPIAAPGETCWDTTRGNSTTCAAVTCSAICNWGSEPMDYCHDGTEGNASSTCGRYGTSRLDSNCLLEPTHAGCNPLDQTSYAHYGICNDGTTVPFVPDVATRPWTSLTSSPTGDGEQQHINALMNNAATLIGCTLQQDYWPVTDVNLDPANQDPTTAAYVKAYANANAPAGGPLDTGCGEVYFNRALGCAFPIAKTDTPAGTPKVRTEAKLYTKWTTSKYTHGLPSSLPHRTFDGTIGWQRFKNAYFTYRYPDSEAYFIGGTIYGTVQGPALAARFGRDFDYYSPTTKTLSLNPTRLIHDTACVNTDSSWLYASCTNKTFGLVGVSATSTFVSPLDSDKAFAVAGDMQTKYFALAGGTTPQMAVGAPPVNPTLATYGLGWPTTDEQTTSAARVQYFTGGQIYAKSGYPARLVANTMAAAYGALGGPSGDLGYPLDDTPTPFGDAIARTQRFEGGKMTLDVGQLEPTIAPDPDPGAPYNLVAGMSSSDDGLPVKLSWFNKSGTSFTRLYWKQMPDTTSPKPTVWDTGWTEIAVDGNPKTLPYITLYDDARATAQAKNCYYVDVNNGYVKSQVACIVPRGPRPDNPQLRRIELRVKVANVSDAGTDDSVHVRLGWKNDTWIDSTIDDFEQGSDHTYFLMPFGVDKLTDITEIRIEVPGDDAVCISELELYVNRQVGAGTTCTTANGCVFRKVFGNTNTTCKWIEESDDLVNGDRLIIGANEMRATPQWNADLTGLMSFGGLDETGLRQALEAIAAHFIHKKPYSLKNGYPMILHRVNNSLGHVDDSGMEVHAILEAYSVIEIEAKTQIYIDPVYDCWKQRTEQITSTQVRMLKPQVNTSLSLWVFDFLNLVWWPAVDPAIHLYVHYFKHDRIRNIDVAPPADFHYCFPTSGGLVNGLFACNNDADNINFAPEIRSQCRTVTARIAPSGAGYVDTLPASSNIQCGDPPYTNGVCLWPYSPPNSTANQVYLHATALPGYRFTGWNVDLSGRPTNPCVATAGTQGEFCYVNTIDNPIVTATFSPL